MIQIFQLPKLIFITIVWLNLKTLYYYLGIEFAYQSSKLALSQMKYALDLLETRLLECIPKTSLMEVQTRFQDTNSLVLKDANSDP